MLVHPQFDPIAFAFGPFTLGGLTLGPFAIRWYGLMYLLAFVLVIVLGRKRARQNMLTGWRPGDIDDRFYIVVSGNVTMSRGGEVLGRIETGGCFGEASYAEGSRRESVIEADGQVTLVKVPATLLEHSSISCQLRFNKVVLRELVTRLQRPGRK